MPPLARLLVRTSCPLDYTGASSHFRYRLGLAQAARTTIRRLSRPGSGLAPFLCHCLSVSLILPILLYGADLFSPSPTMLAHLQVFWRRVHHWVTNCFSATPIPILSIKSSPPSIELVSAHCQRLASLRLLTAPLKANPATACLHPTVPTSSSLHVSGSARETMTNLTSVYAPLNWRTPPPNPPVRRHLPLDAVAHRLVELIEDHPVLPIRSIHLLPFDQPPPRDFLTHCAALRGSCHARLFSDWETMVIPPEYYSFRPRLSPHRFMGLNKFLASHIHQMRAHKSYLAGHPSWSNFETTRTCQSCEEEVESFHHAILACPARAPIRSEFMKDIDDVGPDSPLWSSAPLFHKLASYITVTKTNFPPALLPHATPSSISSRSLPLTLPRFMVLVR